MMMLAIKGLHITPGIGIDKNEALLNLNNIGSSNIKFLGKFSQEGDLHLSELDVKTASSEFKLLIHNRLLHE